MKPNFQLVLIIVFVAFAVFGVLVFSGLISLGNEKNAPGGLGTVVLWGTVPNTIMSKLVEDFNLANPAYIVKYMEKSPKTFDRDLLEALAEGEGPDMFLLPDNLAYHYSKKIFPIPYTSVPLASFKNVFAGPAEVFLTAGGIMAFPLYVDPLMMYYNRSTLDANAVVYPPATWDELIDLVPALTKKDPTNKILKSTVGMGQFSNVANAKELLATLFMQKNNPIIAQKGESLSATLDDVSYDLAPTLKFYTDFADPLHPAYSWNKSFPGSRDAFSAENVAFYFGFASELQSLVNKNPNQNFLAAPVPQVKGSNFKRTFAHVTGVAISSSSKNLTTAFTAASAMSSGDFAGKLATALNVAPARRDLLRIFI